MRSTKGRDELQPTNPFQQPNTANPDSTEQRPEFMRILGLLAPYSLDDVHKAYKARAANSHPDRGGSPEEFVKIQQAYDQAQQHVSFRQGRREWMANLVEPYVKQQEVIEQVHQRKGNVQVEKIDWMQKSFGDFALLTERLRSIDLRDTADADGFLRFLVRHNEAARFLEELDFAGSDLSDAGLSSIISMQSIQRLNLARTRVTCGGLAVLAQLPDLVSIDLTGLSLNWFDRRRIRNRIPQAAMRFN